MSIADITSRCEKTRPANDLGSCVVRNEHNEGRDGRLSLLVLESGRKPTDCQCFSCSNYAEVLPGNYEESLPLIFQHLISTKVYLIKASI